MSTPDSANQILLPRRRPAQQRSREKFDRILAAARAVLVDVGFESFTFDEVAKRAEVPIGTIYQYFANKYVMICELDRHDTAAATEQPMLDIIGDVMRPLAPRTTPEQRLEIASLLVHTVSSLLNYAVHDPTSSDEVFESRVAEIKRMIVAYLFAVATA
nr:TetR/AcrR family transcriptional regulator [Corynebacterium diphtheriae]